MSKPPKEVFGSRDTPNTNILVEQIYANSTMSFGYRKRRNIRSTSRSWIPGRFGPPKSTPSFSTRWYPKGPPYSLWNLFIFKSFFCSKFRTANRLPERHPKMWKKNRFLAYCPVRPSLSKQFLACFRVLEKEFFKKNRGFQLLFNQALRTPKFEQMTWTNHMA